MNYSVTTVFVVFPSIELSQRTETIKISHIVATYMNILYCKYMLIFKEVNDGQKRWME